MLLEPRRWLSAASLTGEHEQVAGLIYATRCCPAHDISEPVWKLHQKYRRRYKVDLTEVDGAAFDPDHIGGWRALEQLADYAHANGIVAV